jgi:cell division protein FtsW
MQSAYQIKQSLIGLGRGGIFGQGLGQSKQKFFFLPDSHTDFVFSILGEEFGFIGTSLVLILFLIIFYRGIRLAFRAPDAFGKFLAVGITVNVVLIAFVNASVVSMLLPATGLPMPFLSYGGSNLLFLGVSIGILLNISRQTEGRSSATNWTEFSQKREQLFQTVITAE